MEENTGNKNKNRNWRVATWMATVYALLIIISFYGCGNKSENKSFVETPVKVSVLRISQSTIGEHLSYSGTIQPDNVVQLGFAVPGRVAEVAIQEGQHVTKGQLLASIETTEYKNAFNISNTGLEQAQDNFKRANELHLKGSLTDKDYIAAKIALGQAEANNNMAEKRLSDSYLKAPFTGIITAKIIERGATALPGVPAFTLMKTDFVYAQASISENDISKLSVGSNAAIIIAAIQDTLNGTISIINPQADLQTKTYSIKIKIANSKGRLMPGMISEIKVATGKKTGAITIPPEAIVRDADGLTYVFVVNSHKCAVRKRITAQGLSDSAVIVSSGLQEGESLVVKGQKNIQEGQTVSVKLNHR